MAPKATENKGAANLEARAAAPVESWSFNDFTLSRTPLQLLRDGQPVQLRKQALRLLELLVENAGEVISHDQIRERVWSGRHVDHAGGMHLLIREIRVALNGANGADKLIETLPTQGYRFLGSVRAIPATATATARPTSSRHWRAAGAACAALALALVAYKIVTPGAAEVDEAPSAARSAYLKGDFVLNQYAPESNAQAKAYFLEAIRYDAAYAPAYAGLAEIAYREGAYDDVETNARAALSFDPDLAMPHVYLASIAVNRDWDFETATRHVDLALQRDPELAAALTARAINLAYKGRYAEALSVARKAEEGDPVSALIRADIGWIHYYARDYAAAFARCTEAQQLQPGVGLTSLCRFKAARMMGDRPRACEAAAELSELWKFDAELIDDLRSNPTLEALQRFNSYRRERMSSFDTNRPDMLAPLAVAYMEIGELETAMQLIDAAVESHAPWLPSALSDPALDPIRAEPRFRNAVLAVGMEFGVERTAETEAEHAQAN